MVKYIALWGIKPGVDPGETWKAWEGHAEWAKKCQHPELKRYVQNRVIEILPGGDVDFIGITEMWFNDLEAARRAKSRVRNAPPDQFLIGRIGRVRRVFAEEIEVEVY